MVNPIPLLLLNRWVGMILAPAFILLCKILTFGLFLNFTSEKKNSYNKSCSKLRKNKSQEKSDMAAFSIKRKP